jgi:hypothetical protein
MSDSNSKSALDSIVKAVIDRDGSSTADTMLVNAHLSQMKMFGIRQGVEFFPQQDNLGTQRFDFIQQVIKFNTLDARLDSIWDRFLAYGKGLFYIRPTRKTYRIYWFDKDSYRTYYTPEGDLEEVIIIYPYKVRSKKGLLVLSKILSKLLKMVLHKDQVFQVNQDSNQSFLFLVPHLNKIQ